MILNSPSSEGMERVQAVDHGKTRNDDVENQADHDPVITIDSLMTEVQHLLIDAMGQMGSWSPGNADEIALSVFTNMFSIRTVSDPRHGSVGWRRSVIRGEILNACIDALVDGKKQIA